MAIRIRARQLGKNIANAGTATEARVLETMTINKGYVLVLIPQYSMAKMKKDYIQKVRLNGCDYNLLLLLFSKEWLASTNMSKYPEIILPIKYGRCEMAR